MGKLFVIVLFSFLISFVWGLVGLSMFESSIGSIDKILRFVLIYFVAILLLLNKEWQFRRNGLHYLFPAMIILSILFLHYLFTTDVPLAYLFHAKKELFRLLSFIVVIFICSGIRLRYKDYRFLIYLLAIYGLPLGILSILHAYTGETSVTTRQMEDLVRSGSEFVSTNSLGAVLNLTTLCAICAVVFANRKSYKVFFLFSAIISQIGRLTTFSNGSLINIIVALMVLLIFFWSMKQINVKNILYSGIIIITAITVFTVVSGKTELFFKRLIISDNSGIQVSLMSRMRQYDGVINLFDNEPLRLLYGTGAAKSPTLLGTGLTLHNAYLRPLVETGIFGFLAFMYIWANSLRYFFLAVKHSSGEKERQILFIFLLSAYIGYSVQIITVPYTTSATLWFFFILACSLRNYLDWHRTPALHGIAI